MPIWKKAIIYLGLGPDEHYESYEDPIRPHHAPAAAPVRYPGAETVAGQGVSVAAGSAPDRAVLGRTVRPISLAPAEDGTPAGNPDAESAVRVVHSVPPKPMKPYAASPDAFNDVQEIGDRFKSGQPVILNIQTLDRDLRRRLVDFCAGLCYAMGGKMDRVADQVYLLTPADVEVSQGTPRRKST